MTNIIEQYEKDEIIRLNKNIPDFSPGDTVVVQVKVIEGSRERLQAFKGVVIAIRNRGLNSSFTVRKVAHGEGVERVFQTYSPLVDSVTVERRGDVRRAKLYYLRDRSGRSARIREKVGSKLNLNNGNANNTNNTPANNPEDPLVATNTSKEVTTTSAE